jgi:hypothetical protein
MKNRLFKRLLKAGIILLLIGIILEIGVRVVIDLPADTDFYSSISNGEIATYQKRWKVKTVTGATWIHLGWIANPDKEVYTIYQRGDDWTQIGETRFGSFLIRHLKPDTTYSFRVRANSGTFDYSVSATTSGIPHTTIYVPVISSRWTPLFRPQKTGSYINDHTLFRSPDGKWHVAGITAFGEGDYSKEIYFAHAVSDEFPPAGMMQELDPIADYGHLAWAPHVVEDKNRLYMWFSPHRGYLATSTDGYHWQEEKEHTFLPYHPQFRDPMILNVSENQWLMYVTARSGYYSTVDVYQSFDLIHWQYIRPALETACGCERAGAQASTESPFVLQYKGRYYLSVTYNNDSFFWNPLMLTMKIWLDRENYNETLMFQSDNPYDFGIYRGRHQPSSLLTVLSAHAPEYVEHDGQWYITTAGWPWISTLTRGEVAYALLMWKVKEE